MRVHAWLADYAGCGYYRGIVPHALLDRLDGVDASSSTQLPAEFDNLEQLAGEVDVLWAQRVTRPEPSAGWQALAALPRDARPALVFDADDALDLIDTTNLMAYDYYRGPKADGAIDRVHDNMRLADVVTTSTRWLAEHLATEVGIADVFVLPNAVDAAIFDEPRHPILADYPWDITVGYQGSDTHHADVRILAYGLKRLAERTDAVGLHMIGHHWGKNLERRSDPSWGRGDYHIGQLAAVWSWPAARTRWTMWLPAIPELYQTIRGFDVGLAPLAPSRFNRAKSALKLVEYGALGVPWIASDFGPYREYADAAGGPDKAGGILVPHREDAWAKALDDLVHDQDQRRELAAAGNAWVRHAFTAQRYTPHRHALYTNLIERTP